MNDTPPTVSLPEGWAIVPVEPTEAMWEAAWEASEDYFVGDAITKEGFRRGIAAMLAASPSHTPAPDTSLPDRMVPWEGGEKAPLDWPRFGRVQYRNGQTSQGGTDYDWRHVGERHDIIAYTPTKPTQSPDAAVSGVREAALEEAACKCLEVSGLIGAANGSSIDSALREAAAAIRALQQTPAPAPESER